MPSAGRIEIRPATIIEGMAPATPMPRPTPNVASRRRGTPGTKLRTTPNPAMRAMHAANASRGPSRAASRGPNGANSPMHSTGIVVRSPASGGKVEVVADQRQQRADREQLLAERERGDEQAGDDRQGDAGEAVDTRPMLSDGGGRPAQASASVAGSGSPPNQRSSTRGNTGASGSARRNSVIDDRSFTA